MRVITVTEPGEYGNDTYFELYVDDKRKFGIGELCECPEDATLWRDLDFVYDIPKLMELAYKAGKNNEDFILESKKRN